MASTGGGDPVQSGPPNVEGEDCDLKMPPSSDTARTDSTSEEHLEESKDQPSGKNNRCPVNGAIEDGGSGNGHIGIPPWTITLVPLIGPMEIESVEIPRDRNLHVACVAPEVKHVSATYAAELLRQIGGLRAIAKQRAEEARDLLHKQRRHTDALLGHRMSELLAMQRDLAEFRRKDCMNQMEATRSLDPNHGIASMVCTADCAVGQPDKPDANRHCKTLECQLQLEVGNICDAAGDKKEHMRPDQGVGKQHYKSDDVMAGACVNEVFVETERPNKRCKRREHSSVSLQEEDVIYCPWKVTKSA